MSNPNATGLQLVFVYRIVFGVPTLAAAEFLAELRLLETTMPMLDPTRWIKQHEQLEKEIKVAEAFLALRQAIDACLPVLEGQSSGK